MHLSVAPRRPCMFEMFSLHGPLRNSTRPSLAPMEYEGGLVFTCIYALANMRNIISTVLPIVLTLVHFSGMRCIMLSTRESIVTALGNMRRLGCWSTELTEDMRPSGIILEQRFPPRFFGWVVHSTYAYVYCREEEAQRILFFQPQITPNGNFTLNSSTTQNNGFSDKSKKLHLGSMKGGFECIRSVTKREISMDYILDTSQQQVFEAVASLYESRGFLSAFISGKAGAGKTHLAYSICHSFGGTLLDFDPSVPSQSIENIYTVTRSHAKPLLLLIDECDIFFKKITAIVPDHKHYVIPVRSKVDFSSMMDKYPMGCYPFCIMLFISNLTREEISKMDPSYLRDRRINLFFKL